MIEAGAKNLGFFLFGISEISPAPQFSVFQDWIANNHHAGMSYLSRDDTLRKRVNPELLFPGAKRIISLAYPYLPAHLSENSIPKNHGRVAAYAWGKDYHQVLPALLEQLVENLTHLEPGSHFKVFTDSAPILERGYAARAGLGWIGKNSCLINPEHGSYFLLAEILTDLELPVSILPVSDHCGSCRRCLDACPTGCILPDRTIDSNRCISYLTIENRGLIAEDLQEKVGNWIFGCDICQMVCPWNQRFALPVNNSLQAEIPNSWVNLAAELSNTSDDFLTRFSNRPQARVKISGWLRNCIVAAGNSRSPDLLMPLAEILMKNPIVMLRSQAAMALGKFAPEDTFSVFEHALQMENDESVRQILLTLLGMSG